MPPSRYPVVGELENDTPEDMRLYLEMVGEEVILSPGHRIELLARPDPDLQPLTIARVDGGMHIHPHRVFDPDWHIRFKGKLIKPGYPTKLAEHE